jgi:nucleoside 2-deoxyribosyltransferase
MEPDSGTVAEVAFAAGLNKKVFGIRTDFRDCGDLPGVALNLQVLFFIENAGGCLYRSVKDITLSEYDEPEYNNQ